nr:galanin receptor 2b-like [Lytechinus pictus]
MENTTNHYQDSWTWAPVSWEWWEILQLILAIIGIIGNFLVMIVLLRPRHRRCATDTLIGALAVADFLTSVFIIPHQRVISLPDNPGGQAYCRIIHSSVLMWISICASIFTLTTISIERLAAVRYPSCHQVLFTHTRSPILIVILWLIAVVINTFSLYVHFVQGGICVTQFPSSEFQKFIGVSLFIIEYVVPIITNVTAHSMTLYSLRRRSKSSNGNQGQEQMAPKLKEAQRRVLRMLLIVVIIFIVCWTPDQFGFLVFNLGVVDVNHLFSPLYRCFVILAFANSCANPFIYAGRSPGFRKAFFQMFGGKSRRYGAHSVFADLLHDSNSTFNATSIGEMSNMDKI